MKNIDQIKCPNDPGKTIISFIKTKMSTPPGSRVFEKKRRPMRTIKLAGRPMTQSSAGLLG